MEINVFIGDSGRTERTLRINLDKVRDGRSAVDESMVSARRANSKSSGESHTCYRWWHNRIFFGDPQRLAYLIL